MLMRSEPWREFDRHGEFGLDRDSIGAYENGVLTPTIPVATGTAIGAVVRPGRFAVHPAAVDDQDCWRCSDKRPHSRSIGTGPDPELSRGR